MKNLFAAIFAMCVMACGASYAQEAAASGQVEAMNADEQSFAAQLDDMHKALFATMSAEQRAQAMESSAQPNEAVQTASKMVAQAE
jgi:hypothetical protein